MEKRWNVYHGNESLGLKTAKEIREALRAGTLDAFDRVSLEGSNIREDLIDVDEIFRESVAEPEASEAAVPPKASFDEDVRGTVVAIQPKAAGAAQQPEPPAPIELARTAASYSAAHAPRAAAPQYAQPEYSGMRFKEEATQTESIKTTTKRYYILDREKVLGPLAALEIQSLYNRGVLNKKVKVQKIGGNRTMSITQFIASYSGDRMKELTEDGKIPQQIGVGSPSSKVLTELARMASSRRVAQQRQQKTLLVVSAVGILVGLLAYLVVQHNREKAAALQNSRQTSETTPNRDNEAGLAGARPRLIQKSPEATPGRALPAPPPSSPPEPKPLPKKEKEAPPPLARSGKSTPPSRKAPKEPIAARGSEVSKPTLKKEIDREKKPAGLKIAAAPSPQPIPIPSSGAGPISKAIAGAGRIQTVGQVMFQISALDDCATKCTLVMKDASGATLKAIFFKNAYYDALKARSKGVTITGSTKLERGELIVIIQDVR